MKRWIELPRIEGEVSRQAHADLPAGTFEREIGRSGFFGPASHIYHRHAPTGWTSFEGPLRPRAFDAKAAARTSSSPFDAPFLLCNADAKLRVWACDAAMTALACRSGGQTGAPVRAFQTRAVPSTLAVSRRCPFGLNWACVTLPSCPSGGEIGALVVASQRRAV